MDTELAEPTPKTEEEFVAYVRSVLDMSWDYDSSANALWQVALAGFNYAAHVVGASGFQGEYAALHFYGLAVGIKGPFGVLRGNDLVYPQYDLHAKLTEWIEEWRPWAAEQARERLAGDMDLVHPEVRAHWERLAAQEAPTT